MHAEGATAAAGSIVLVACALSRGDELFLILLRAVEDFINAQDPHGEPP
jgi:hypothetical protein